MLGKSGKIVCILKVDPLYSSGQGHVHLLGVEGGAYHKEIQHLQVRWYLNLIEHLLDSLHQEAFVNAPRNKREARLTSGRCGGVRGAEDEERKGGVCRNTPLPYALTLEL